MAIITLLTDFGTQDEYVGVIKGVIADIDPMVQVIDISHHIGPQDIVHGAVMLSTAYPYFPAGTVHVAVVDPGVGGARRILAVACDGHRFLLPDNGLVELVVRETPATHAVAVENPRYFLKAVSRTFHGRDIFAPVAAYLAAGLPLAELGPAVDPKSFVTDTVPRCRFSSAQCLEGMVLVADHFGNLMTNIDVASIDALTHQAPGKKLIIDLGGQQICDVVPYYDHVANGEPLAIIGSRGLLEISVNCGNAQQTLRVGIRDTVRMRLIS